MICLRLLFDHLREQRCHVRRTCEETNACAQIASSYKSRSRGLARATGSTHAQLQKRRQLEAGESRHGAHLHALLYELAQRTPSGNSRAFPIDAMLEHFETNG
jgi:hypothetical protein